MRDEKWTDCPVCGSKGTMRMRRGLSEQLHPAGYPSAPKIAGLSGQFCSKCGDGFWSKGSEQKIAQHLAKHMAEHDSQRVVASDLASVKDAAKLLRVTPQAIHKMMGNGRLRSVFVAGKRLPIRNDVLISAKARSRVCKRAS